jgi:hypothetical protein
MDGVTLKILYKKIQTKGYIPALGGYTQKRLTRGTPKALFFHLFDSHFFILSVCETGTGQLVRVEGLMILSRAFAYTGCPNIITSL